jgi:hypothetical protein
MMRYGYSMLSGFLLLLISGLIGPRSLAQVDLPDARLQFQTLSGGLLVGIRRGSGVLTFEGRDYRFQVRGFTLFDIGGSKVEGLGVVYNLTNLADFEGTYGGVEGGLTTIQGGTSAVLANGNGVRIQFDTLQYGLQFSLGGGGLTFEFEQDVSSSDGGDDEMRPAY